MLIRQDEDKNAPLAQHAKVRFNPKDAISIDFEGGNRRLVARVQNVAAMLRAAQQSPPFATDPVAD